MKTKLSLVVAAAAGAMIFGGASGALAKAHDQGVADGKIPFFPEAPNAGERIDLLTDAGVLDGQGVSALFKGGARGEDASTRKSGVRVVPVVNDKQPD